MNQRRITLDGTWEFLHAGDNRPPIPLQVRTIEVPGPWQAQFADLRMRAGTGIYRRMVEVPADWLAGDRVHLRFGAVFHNTRVWVNGKPVGENEGGFLPFAFDVTDQLVTGANEVKLRVESPTDDPAEFPDAPFAEIPFGKQSWYGPLSGVWQSVVLERRNRDHVSRVRILPDLATGRVRVGVFFAHLLSQFIDLEMRILSPDGSVAASASEGVLAGAGEACFDVGVERVLAWSPDTPNLYQAVVTVRRDGVVLDEMEEMFGFRTFEAHDGKFYLNGELIYLRGALDQDYYPDGIATVPSVEFLEDQFRKAKQLGLNCLRCHIKAADPRYYEAADRIGLLIWTELPNGGLSTERSRRRKEALLKGIVDRDGCHPSIVIWTIINENWGVDLVHDADHRAWLKRTYHWLKAYDPTRLVVDNSPLAPSFHVETDVADYHFYAAIPDNRWAWEQFVDQLSERADWLYSPEGDAAWTGQEPLLCSEFGNWGLPDPDDLKDAEGREPWWFETGHDWGEGVMYAHGVENRFSDWSLDRAFGSLKRFVEAAQWQQFRALKYQIEAMRRKSRLAGYVITEFTDAHWESNGLLDMRRNTRAFHDVFHTINADTVIVPRWSRLSYWSGETVQLQIAVAHGAGSSLSASRLEVVLGSARYEHTFDASPGEVVDLGQVEIDGPVVDEAGMHRMDFNLRSAEGEVIATNHLDMAVHPRRAGAVDMDGLAWSPDPRIRSRLEDLGYRTASSMDQALLVVATHHDPALARHVRAGGRLLLLPEDEGTLYPFFPHWQNVTVRKRDGTVWRGDWASSFSWLKRSGAFARIPGEPMVDLTMDRVIPTHVIAGPNLLDFQARVHAGLVVGWIHKPVALAIERAYGSGHFVASTFRLFQDAPGEDPTATALLDALISLAVRAPARMPREEVEAL